MAFRFELLTNPNDDRPVYAAGNFSDWLPDLDTFQLQVIDPGHYALNLPDETVLPDPLVFKYTRGGWDTVEINADGQVVSNRIVWQRNSFQIDTVLQWQWLDAPANPEDRLPLLDTIAEFSMPQFDTTRRIRVLLPYDYDQTGKRYPVLYMQDGQNLLGDGNGYGSWQLEWQLANLATQRKHELIVVAIDHGGNERIVEMTPEHTRIGPGRGMDYLRFIVETLKPHIDHTYPTRPDAAQTGIGGSSLGGLISLYGGLRFPDVFGRWLVFSPSLWVTGDVYVEAKHLSLNQSARLFLYGGAAESKHMLPALDRLQAKLHTSPGHNQLTIRLETEPDGTHSEIWWSQWFAPSVAWLFQPDYTYRHSSQLLP